MMNMVMLLESIPIFTLMRNLYHIIVREMFSQYISGFRLLRLKVS